jgi:hypothetical protein
LPGFFICARDFDASPHVVARIIAAHQQNRALRDRAKDLSGYSFSRRKSTTPEEQS